MDARGTDNPSALPRGPTRLEQGQCRDFDSLVALFMRYGADPFMAQRRAQHVLDGRARPKPFCLKRRR